MENLKQKFYKTYNNLPLGLREEVILVINSEAITWKVARLEVDNNTPLAKKILERLEGLEFI